MRIRRLQATLLTVFVLLLGLIAAITFRSDRIKQAGLRAKPAVSRPAPVEQGKKAAPGPDTSKFVPFASWAMVAALAIRKRFVSW